MEQAFLKAYDDYADELYRTAVFRVHDEELARDIVQDTFMRTWKRIADGAEIRELRAFLHQTLRRLAIDQYRKKTTDSLDTLREGGFDRASNDHEEILQNAIYTEALTALEQLREEDRDLLMLRFVDDLPPKTIAVILNISANAASVRIDRALGRARAL